MGHAETVDYVAIQSLVPIWSVLLLHSGVNVHRGIGVDRWFRVPYNAMRQARAFLDLDGSRYGPKTMVMHVLHVSRVFVRSQVLREPAFVGRDIKDPYVLLKFFHFIQITKFTFFLHNNWKFNQRARIDTKSENLFK